MFFFFLPHYKNQSHGNFNLPNLCRHKISTNVSFRFSGDAKDLEIYIHTPSHSHMCIHTCMCVREREGGVYISLHEIYTHAKTKNTQECYQQSLRQMKFLYIYVFLDTYTHMYMCISFTRHIHTCVCVQYYLHMLLQKK